MRFVTAIFFCFACLAASPAHADIDQIQAREIARNNNCTPKKVGIFQQTLGAESFTIYRIDCTMPKTTDANAAKGADALLVSCKKSLCELLRPMAGEASK